jgi:small redox-active disulfide protein 2
MKVEVLGSGCANCRNTMALIEQVAKAAGVDVDLRKVEDIQQIIGYGVMTTPAVAIDGKVVHSGGVPRREAIEQWLAATNPASA